jgi:hypothetical protein
MVLEGRLEVGRGIGLTPLLSNGSLPAVEGWNSPCLAASEVVLKLMVFGVEVVRW